LKAGVKRVPEEFHTITPHLVVRGVPEAVEFYRKAFGAQELFRNMAPDGKTVVHSELLLGDSRFFLNDEFPEHGAVSPKALNGSAVTLHLYVEDVDAVYQQAVEAGAQVVFPLADCFWGDRYAQLKDPFGHSWSVASRIEDLSPAELKERATEFFSKVGG
jgi:PhnB protein